MIAGVPIPPPPAYFITDTAHAISAATQQNVEAELEAFERKTTDQVVVWIGDSTGDTPLETWTVDAAQKWRVGQRGKDNGVVLFLFMKDRSVRIEVGYGLEATLTDATSAEIERDTIEPAMRSGNVDEAVTGGVAAILHAIDTDSPRPAKPSFSIVGAIGAVFMSVFRAINAVIDFFGHLIVLAGNLFYTIIVSVVLLALALGLIVTFFDDISKWLKIGKR